MLLVSLTIFLYFYFKYFDEVKNGFIKFIIVIGCVIAVFVVFKDIISLIDNVINRKMLGSENYEARMSHVEESISYLDNENIMFGYGPASYNTLDKGSYFSFFFTVLLDSGIIGIICLIWFLLKQTIYILKIRDKPFQCCCIISFVTATAHYIYIGNYYYPWYWFFLSMMYIFYLRGNKTL
ncbi:hypothetical protein FACS189451_02960 [Bacteroidia bacterium]|nr:hypothetical protein FACS189451_02960 [Bacteroidia bacterium]